MTYSNTQLADVPLPAASVAVLRCRETFKMDPAPLIALFGQLSERDAEDIVCRVLEGIAERLDDIQRRRRVGDHDGIRATAKRMTVIAEQMGLLEISSVAEHVANCAQDGCGVALGATIARLERAFDAAVSNVWDYAQYNRV